MLVLEMVIFERTMKNSHSVWWYLHTAVHFEKKYLLSLLYKMQTFVVLFQFDKFKAAIVSLSCGTRVQPYLVPLMSLFEFLKSFCSNMFVMSGKASSSCSLEIDL